MKQVYLYFKHMKFTDLVLTFLIVTLLIIIKVINAIYLTILELYSMLEKLLEQTKEKKKKGLKDYINS